MDTAVSNFTIASLKLTLLLMVIFTFLSAYRILYEGGRKSAIEILYRFLRGDRFCKTVREPEGIVLGKNILGRYVCAPMDNIRHVLVIGTSGCGKTSANLIPTLRSIQGEAHSYVVDLGDIMENVPAWGEQRFILEPGNRNSMRFDVFAEVDGAETEAEKNELLDMIAHRLMPDSENAASEGDWFVREGRKILIAALKCFYFFDNKDFVQIAEIIAGHDTIDLLNLIAGTCNQEENIMRYIRGFSGANERNTAGCKQAVDAALNLFATNEVVKAVLGRGENSFSAADLERGDVVIRAQSNRLMVYKPLIGLVTGSFVQFFQDRMPVDGSGRKKKDLFFCLDELNAYGEGMLQGLEELLKRGRKHGIAVMACTQSLSDLYVIYGHDATNALMENFSYVCVLQLGAADLVSQRYFAELSGRRRRIPGDTSREEYTYSTSEFATLDRKLVLFYPGGCRVLKKAYYWK